MIYPMSKSDLLFLAPPRPAQTSGDVLMVMCELISERVVDAAKTGKTNYQASLDSLTLFHHKVLNKMLAQNFPDSLIEIRYVKGRSILYIDWL